MSNKVKVTVWVDEELRRRAKIKAAQTDRSISSVLRECLERWIEEDLPEPEGQQEGHEKETI